MRVSGGVETPEVRGWGGSVRTHTGGTCRGYNALPLLQPLRAPGAAHSLRERRGSGGGMGVSQRLTPPERP